MARMKSWSGVLIASAVLHAGVAHAAVVLDDQFASWHFSSTNTANFYASADGSSLSWKTGAGSSLASVTFAKQTLAVGESLTAQFTFSASNVVSTALGFRVGVMDSHNNPIVDNGRGIANDMFRGYTGYVAMTDLGNSSTGPQLDYRAAGTSSDSSNNLMGSGYPKPFSVTSSNANISSDTPTTGTFTITRTAAGVKVDFVLGSTNFSYTDTTNNFTSFDSLVFQATNTQASWIVFSDVAISKSVVPEPGSATLSLGLLAGVGLLAGRNLMGRK